MTDKEKINKIEEVIADYNLGQCPYCHTKLTPFFTGKEKEDGCDGCDAIIKAWDYFNAIRLIVKYGDSTQEKFKKLSEY